VKRQFVIVGLGEFGWRMLERLSEISDDIVVIDKDKDMIEKAKDLAKQAFAADALNEKALGHLVPPRADAAVVDLGDSLEASIMATSQLKGLGIGSIVVKTDTEERGRILEMVGATRVVYPDREAADQVAPLLASSELFAFMPIGPGIALGEVKAPRDVIGKTLVEADLRRAKNVNVVAVRKAGAQELSWVDPAYRMGEEDSLLVAGSEKAIFGLSGENQPGRKRGLMEMMLGKAKK
jgi:trk system potassium uptake protein TrkA